jgi:hypothetical protein
MDKISKKVCIDCGWKGFSDKHKCPKCKGRLKGE